ncbi:MAG: hypothetical protein LBJ00_11230 [Planctomycetaceae bacterium]|jgi:hypothetical protein|nr:hypothetical protein [Planctomycetaceae bacterium]
MPRIKRNRFNCTIIFLLFYSTLNIFSNIIFAAIPESPQLAQDYGVYLTKTEFESFLQKYQNEHSANSNVGKNLSWRKGNITITPYGFINFSMSYETERTVAGDYVIFANSPDLESGASFNVDPKSSRLGFNIESPGIAGWRGSRSKGVIEFDFQGAFQSRNRAGLLLRKAYVEVSDGRTKFLAGQDWEIISPLYPNVLNYTSAAYVGNVGYRRAMLRVERRTDFCQSNYLTTQFGIADHVFRDNTAVSPAVSSFPDIQGRLAYSFGKGCFEHGKPITLGVSSHFGEQRFTFGNDKKNLNTWSFNVDFDLPITKKLGFQMEYFLGENLATIEGGIWQGVDAQRRNTIRAQGGWASLIYKLTEKLQTNWCYMIDDPFNKDVVAGNAGNNLSRNYNHCIAVNALYQWNKSLMTGFEVSFWRTHWQRYDTGTQSVIPLATGKSTRYEFVVRYTF